MRLVVDLTGVQTQSRFRGIGRYTRGLIAGLARTAGQHEVWLAGPENLGEGLEAARAGFAGLIPAERIVGYRVLDQVQSGIAEHNWRRSASELVRDHFLGSMGADAILFSSLFEGFSEDAITSAGDLTDPALRAVIAYDLIPLLNPNHYLTNPQVKAWYYAKLAAFQSCDLFLAISKSAAAELTDYLGIGSDRIAPIMGGADEFAAAVAGAREEDIDLGSRFGLTKPFFVYAASFDKRKNFENLIAAFSRFSELVGTTHQLALVTSDDAFALGKLSDMVAAAGIAPADVVITGQVRDDELRALYRSSVALVHPSTHEGFGLPILEAMHLDTAVIGSNASSIPEIIGLEEAMFDPASVDDIADKMVRVARDDAFRFRLRQNAVARRGEFSWDRTASAAWRALEAGCANRLADASAARGLTGQYDALLSSLRRLDEQPLQPSAQDRRALANAIAWNLDVIDRLAPVRDDAAAAWRIEGPIEGTCEAALINRETARALSSLGKTVLLRPMDRSGDRSPDEARLAKDHPDILELLRATPHASSDPIVLRNGGSLDAGDPAGIRRIGGTAWLSEHEAGFGWVDRGNLHLDGIACSSAQAKKHLQDSGVARPLAVVGQGVDHWDRIPEASSKPFPGKAFRFLHVSACDPRSGIDVLLAAYGDAFRGADDVTLVIKTDDRPDNPIHSLLGAARARDRGFPDVALVIDDLSDTEAKALYGHCHVLAAPSRAEDFGLAAAQALIAGLPVITTNWGGQLDFCSEQTGWLIDYSFAQSAGGPGATASAWAEPDRKKLAGALSAARRASPEALALKAAAGRAVLLERYTWAAVADRLAKFACRTANAEGTSAAYVAWIGPRDRNGEIQAYCDRLLEHLPLEAAIFAPATDEGLSSGADEVGYGAALVELAGSVDLTAPDAVVIQLDHSPIHVGPLECFVRSQKDRSRAVVIDFHGTTVSQADLPSGVGALFAMCDRVVVHTLHDLNRLKVLGLVGNVAWLPYASPTSETAGLISDAGYERLSARFAGLIEALRENRDGGAAHGAIGDDLAAEAGAGGLDVELSEEGIGMGPAEQVRSESPGQEERPGRDLDQLRQERDALQKSLRASLRNVRALEAQLAAARGAGPVPPQARPLNPSFGQPAPPEPPGAPPPQAQAPIGWRKRLVFLAYRPFRPLVRPMLWRLRGFIVAGVWEADPHVQRLAAVQDALQAMNQRLLEIQGAVAGVNARMDVDKGSMAEMKRLSHEMEKALLSLAIDANRGVGRPMPDYLEM